jgi:LacI family transcriptional regulator
MPFITSYFFVELLRGIQDCLYAKEYDLILCGVNHASQLDAYLHRSLRGGHVDGILLASLSVPDSYEKKLMEMGIPVVLVDRYNQNFDSYTISNSIGVRRAIDHLVDLHHRHIAMINGDRNAFPSVERLQGYLAYLESHRDVTSAGVFYPAENARNDGYNEEAGYNAMAEILAIPNPNRPTAVFVASDIQAIGALRALKEKGYACPGDMSLVSFDDIELAQYYDLTTVRQPIQQMGSLATERLLDILTNGHCDPVHREFTPELIVRHTTGEPQAPNDSNQTFININQ